LPKLVIAGIENPPTFAGKAATRLTMQIRLDLTLVQRDSRVIEQVISGVELDKPFRILIEGYGGVGMRIAKIAGIPPQQAKSGLSGGPGIGNRRN
jgi:hypothetical protein